MNGAPGTHSGPPTAVPAAPPAIELSTCVPVPSFSPQRAINPLPLLSCCPRVAAIWLPVRATFQIRASSMTPLKAPSGSPVESMAVPSAACWMLSDRGVKPPTASV
jgi:hypothetical protein